MRNALRGAGVSVPGVVRTRALRADGVAFDVEIRFTTFEQAGGFQELAHLRDLGPELSAERERQEGQDFYRAIFEENTAVKFLIDPSDGRIVDANAAAARFYGWPRDTLRAMRLSQINTLSAEEIATELENARCGRRQFYRFRHRLASGEIRHVEVHTGGIQIAGRSLLFSIVTDATERFTLEEQLRQARELEAIGRIAGGVAHDFNNLLAVINAASEQLGQALGPSDGRREALGEIAHATGRATELTRQLFAVGGKQPINPRPVQINDVISGVRSMLARAVGDRVTLRLALDPGLPAVAVDAGQFEHVLLNLAINARDAMNGSGAVVISTRALGLQVALEVTDSGHGMDAATKSRIFEPFFTTKPRGQGTGLGLATAHGIVTQSGGTISVESEPGRGATFTVLLPVYGVLPRASEGVASRHRVLLVEDESELRRALAARIQEAAYEVVCASSAEEALPYLSGDKGRFDALITDIELPGRSGLELVREIRARHREMAVVLIAGKPLASDRMPEGVGFLQKPFSRQALIRELRQRIAHHRE